MTIVIIWADGVTREAIDRMSHAVDAADGEHCVTVVFPMPKEGTHAGGDVAIRRAEPVGDEVALLAEVRRIVGEVGIVAGPE